VVSLHDKKGKKTKEKKMSAKKKTVNTGTNLDRLRERFGKEKSGVSANYWRPDWGNNTIRILPAVDEEDVFYVERHRHRIDDEWHYCLRFDIDSETGRGKRCPVCEMRRKLFRTNDKAMIEIAREIKPKKQYLMNIVDRKSDDPTQVFVYAPGVKLKDKIVSIMLDEDIDITDVEAGYDFIVKKEEGPRTDAGQFPTYENSKAARKETPLHEDPKVVTKILDNRYDLHNLVHFEDEETLQTIVDNYIKSLTSGESNEDFYGEDESENERGESRTSKSRSKKLDDFKSKLKSQLREDEDDFDEDDDE
jgi:hypothetical protein